MLPVRVVEAPRQPFDGVVEEVHVRVDEAERGRETLGLISVGLERRPGPLVDERVTGCVLVVGRRRK